MGNINLKRREEIRLLRSQGKSLRQIADAYGFSRAAARYYLADNLKKPEDKKACAMKEKSYDEYLLASNYHPSFKEGALRRHRLMTSDRIIYFPHED